MGIPNLKDFKKRTAQGPRDRITSSVNLEPRHLEFLRKHNLNMGKLIRDYLDQLIQSHKDDMEGV